MAAKIAAAALVAALAGVVSAQTCTTPQQECSITANSWYRLTEDGVGAMYTFTDNGPYSYAVQQNCTSSCIGASIVYSGPSWSLNRTAGLISFVDETCTNILTSGNRCFACQDSTMTKARRSASATTTAGASSFTYPFIFSANCLVLFVNEGGACLHAYYPVPVAAAAATGLSGGAIAGIVLGVVAVSFVGVFVFLRVRARDTDESGGSYKTIPAAESEASDNEHDEEVDDADDANDGPGDAGSSTEAGRRPPFLTGARSTGLQV